MNIATDTALTSVSSTVVNSLNSKLNSVRKTFHAHHPGNPDFVLSYGVVDKDDVSIFTLVGIVDTKVAPDLHTLLDNCISRKQNIIICMSDVLCLDTAGAAIILEAYAAARDKDLEFMLADISPNALHTICLCRLNQVLPMCEHIDDAEQCIQSLRCTKKR